MDPRAPESKMIVKTKLRPHWEQTQTQIMVALLLAATGIQSQNIAAPNPLPAQPVALEPWHITQRDFHSQKWEAAVPVVDPISGQITIRRETY